MSVFMIFADTKAGILLILNLGVLILLPVFVGCNPHTTNKKLTPLVTAHPSYSLTTEGIPFQNRWWETLNDPVLDSLIEEALSSNLTLKQIHARIEQTIAAEKQATSFMFPELNAGASGKKDWESDSKAENTYNTSLSLSWEIDLWGRISSARKAAQHDIMAAREELEAAALLLSAGMAETYFQIIEQNLQLLLLDQQIKAGKTFLELIELRFSYGESSVVDVYQQRQQLASTRSQVPVVKSRLRTLENRLQVQLGRSPGDLTMKVAADFSELPKLPLTGIPVNLLQNRPDLRRIYNEMTVIDYRVAESVADRFPKIQLGGSAGFTDGFSLSDRLMTLLLQAIAPVIDWDRRSSEVRKREAMFREELARYSESYLVAIEEVENALWQEKYQLDLLQALENQISVARSNLNETRNRYQQGLTDYLPVLTALQSLQRLERDILSSRRQLISIRILLYRSLGGSRLMAREEYVESEKSNISEGIVK
jgi:NodT family efflux transporter outer membrane factor (OMF) lipoprotein